MLSPTSLSALAAQIIIADTAASREHAAARRADAEYVTHAIAAGERLIEAKALVPHGSWLPWLTANVPNLSERRAQRYVVAAKKAAVGGKSDAATYLLSQSGSGSNGRGDEWFSPAECVEAVRQVLGDIDLDPASCDEAQETVRATTYFTADDDGLSRPWSGRIWLNPPHSRKLIGQFVEKLIAEFQAGHVEASVMLTPNRTDSAWFGSAASAATLICFPSGRIRFVGDPTIRHGSPRDGSVFHYFGPDRERFAAVFGALGMVMTK